MSQNLFEHCLGQFFWHKKESTTNELDLPEKEKKHIWNHAIIYDSLKIPYTGSINLNETRLVLIFNQIKLSFLPPTIILTSNNRVRIVIIIDCDVNLLASETTNENKNWFKFKTQFYHC